MKPFALQARYVLPMDGSPPIEGGIVSIAGEQISAVGKNTTGSLPLDLGEVALLPGLVNTHTHLEFSHLRQPLGQPGQSLPAWIRDVLTARQKATTHPDPQSAISTGIQECLATGTTTIGEIATQEISLPMYANAGAEITHFCELLGLPEERILPLQARAESHLALLEQSPANLHAGLSPHAPYSVHPEIVRWAAEKSKSAQQAVAMHLAESPEELELLARGSGPFVELLEERGVWTPQSLAGVSRPLDYLHMLSRAQRALIIHGNYLQRDELEFLAAHPSNMTLVYCPRTHAYFGHRLYPLREAIELGVQVALGTDSRASNPDLSLLAEMRFIARHHVGISPQRILQLGTAGGAKALGGEQLYGTLAPGKLANLCAIPLSGQSDNPYEEILQGETDVQTTWCRGKPVYQSN